MPDTAQKDNARALVAALVQKFQADPNRHKHNEDQTRHYYILPLLRALGWNTEDPADMTAEEQISRGRVDFGFYLNGVPQFYVETKRANRHLDDPENIQQSITYAYLKGVTWAVLTDFDHLMVFNADQDEADPLKTRLLNLRHTDYVQSFDLLWLLSKPAMQSRPRQIDKTAEQFGKKATRASISASGLDQDYTTRDGKRLPITDALFQDLADWRQSLFNNITLYKDTNWSDDKESVDNAVQKFFDRLIFLRTLEDRGVEPVTLKPLMRDQATQKGELFAALKTEFRSLDAVYNSNLFAHHLLDDLTVYDPDLIEDILRGLYGSNNIEYDFSIISADLLGTVYEQYLSFKATDDPTTRKRRTKSAKRGSKRHQQGIYYTPQYIVRYIVQQTLMPVLQAAPDPTKITVIDPACGSGAFLIEAFDVLDRYFATLQPDLPERQRRERILQNNLYGVDLDPQAVEVTRLNLVLRAAYERQKLPMLTHIQHGNSLVDDPQTDPNAFQWDDAFSLVTQERGGFDVVIGNPPYVRQENLTAAFKTYGETHYTTATGTADLYVYFVERGFTLLREGGRLGYILPNKWLRANYGKPLRTYLSDKVTHLVDFGDLPVFAEATTYPLVMTLQRGATAEPTATTAHSLPTHKQDKLDTHLEPAYTVPRNNLTAKGWALGNPLTDTVMKKLRTTGVTLGQVMKGKIHSGVKTGRNEAFVIDRATRAQLIADDPNSADLIKPYIVGRDAKRYEPLQPKQWVILMPSGWTDTQTDADDKWKWLSETYPAIAKHLKAYQSISENRSDRGVYWWELRSCRYYDKFEQDKIVVPEISLEGNLTLDRDSNYLDMTGFIIATDSRYLLGILNSKVVTFFMQQTSSQIRGGYLRWKLQYMKPIPLPNMAADDPRRQHVADLAQRLLNLHQERAPLTNSRGLNAEKIATLTDQIQQTETQLDTLVYDLYSLTEPERAHIQNTLATQP